MGLTIAGNDAQRERRRARSQDVKCTDWVTRDFRRDLNRRRSLVGSLYLCVLVHHMYCTLYPGIGPSSWIGSMQVARLTVRDPCLARPRGKLRPHWLPRSVRRPPSDEMETSQNHDRPSEDGAFHTALIRVPFSGISSLPGFLTGGGSMPKHSCFQFSTL